MSGIKSDKEIKRKTKSFRSRKKNVGNTPCIKTNVLGAELGIDNIYLKFEGLNPTGTQKDRIAKYCIEDAIIYGKENITVGSCGNYGVAISYMASKADIKAHICVPKEFTGKRISCMEEYGANIIRIPGKYEASVEESKRLAHKNKWYDANPGGQNTVLGMLGYINIANELISEIETPDTISVALGNGTTLAGIHLGYRIKWREKELLRMPHMLGGSTSSNPICVTYNLGKKKIIELDPYSIEETEVNEPLINWRSYDGQYALDAIYDSHGATYSFFDDELIEYAKLIKKSEGINVLPASCAALGALIKYLDGKGNKKSLTKPHVVVITGKGEDG